MLDAESLVDGDTDLSAVISGKEHLQDLVADYKMHLVQIHKNGNLHFRNEGVRTVFVNCRLSYTCNVFCDWKRHSKYATLSPDKVL